MISKIILDSNVIIMMGKGVITPSMFYDLLEQKIEFITTSTVIEELKNLVEYNEKKIISKEINFALEIIKNNKIEIIDTSNIRDADDSLFSLSLSLKNNGEVVYVATNDKELRVRLKIVGIPTIYYRDSRSGLEVDWIAIV